MATCKNCKEEFMAFPLGTGITHTFLNNTDKNVLLLIDGEATKNESHYSYALHPENEKRKAVGGPHEGLARKNTKIIE